MKDGRRGARIAFSFSPFSFPLADSEKLMTERYDNLLLGALCPVRPVEMWDGAVAALTADCLRWLSHRACLCILFYWLLFTSTCSRSNF